ncbi:DUF559 domain-containing protein [Mycolicibacterium sp. P9-64]|uniref:DUF559 domain-containing protein n=1 Tax=Mycolicibacterium sp. P9-64 TaxID=2024612 RepID=UPI0011ED51E1|nr:DUF559 domain-containing protein [Mycolicibacterium sp. P9-64]KAA0082829.1 DUF559 domain-containing protein [Mycolicibacterium sp. P9-64]
MAAPRWPFVGTEALAAGTVTDHRLRSSYVAVHRNVYVPRGVELTATDKAVAAWLFSRRIAVVAGLSAAALHGTRWIDPNLPAELNRQGRDKVDGIVLHSDALADDEICIIDGIPATTPARTAFDIGRRRGLEVAVIRLDALMHATKLKTPDIDLLVERHAGARGIIQLRNAISLADGGAESPQETRTRLLLVAAGLPQPTTQIEVHDDDGYFVARVDMGWRQYKVGVEYDGAQHWTDASQRSRDIDRIAELNAMRWTIVRVSSEMLRHRPATVVTRVRTALRERGLVVDRIA